MSSSFTFDTCLRKWGKQIFGTTRFLALYYHRNYLSNDIAVKLRTEAATVTIAMKLFSLQYVDPKTHFRSRIVTKLKLQFNEARSKSAKLMFARKALGMVLMFRCAVKEKKSQFFSQTLKGTCLCMYKEMLALEY